MRIENLAAIASSGMRLESQRFAQSAANIANASTPGYTARRIVAASSAGGSVSGTSVPTYGPRGLHVETDGGASDGSSTSNTDLIDETVTQLSSLRAFQANVAVLRTGDEMLGELINRRA